MNVPEDTADLEPVEGEASEAITMRADFDTMRTTIARRSIAMAEAVENHPQLLEVMRKMVHGVFVFARVHQIDVDDIEITGFMTPDGNIVVRLRTPEV